MQEQELFQGYEVKNWDFSPRLYKILIFSAVFNVFAIFALAQTNLLTMKGCDSPLVGGVCQVLDTLVVGGTALTTDTAMIDADYNKTTLPSADEIVWIPVSSDPFNYPEGYFALSNPQSVMSPTEIPSDGSFPENIPGIPNPTIGGGADLIAQQPVLPKSNPNAVKNLPSSPFSIDDNPTLPKSTKNPTRVRTPKSSKNPTNPTLSNDSPNLPDLEGKTATTDNNQSKNPTTDKVSDVVINKKVMKDFAQVVKTKNENKEVDLTQNFKVVVDGVLTKDGKLDVTTDKKTKQPKSQIVFKDGNPAMVSVVEQAIAAIGDSGYLGYLRGYGIEKINFTIVQDNDNLQVIITSEQLSPERAQTMASGFNGLIQTALLADKNPSLGIGKPLGNDERVLLSNTKVTDSGKQFVLNFLLPKQQAQEIITRKLKEPAEEKTNEQKPNGSTAQIKDNNNNTSK